MDAQLLQHSQHYEDVRRELRGEVERAKEEVRQEAEQQQKEEADDRKRWKRDMRERLTVVHKQLTQQPASATTGTMDEERLRAVVDERVSALTAHYERTIADLTHRVQSLESRLTLSQHTAVPPLSPTLHQPTALSLSLSPSSASILSYPVRSLSPSQSSHTPPSQQPRSVLKKAVRFNEDVRQRMFTTVRGDEEEKERDDEYDARTQRQGRDEDEFDMFQTRTVSQGRSAAPSAAVSEVVGEVKEQSRDEVQEGTLMSAVERRRQEEDDWSTLSAPTAARLSASAALVVKDEPSLSSSSTSYNYETTEDSPRYVQQPQVQAEAVQHSHESSGDSSSSDEEEEDEMDSTDDEVLDLTDLGAVTEPAIDAQPPASNHQADEPTQAVATATTANHPTLSSYPTTRQTPASAAFDSDGDSDDDAVVTRSTPQSHLPPLSSLQSAGGVRYKSSLAIRSSKATSAAVVGDSEAVQDILTGGRNKQLDDERKEADMDVDDTTFTSSTAAVAAVADDSSDDSEAEDGGRGGWQLQSSEDSVFGGGNTASQPSLSTDSDDDDDVVLVKG